MTIFSSSSFLAHPALRVAGFAMESSFSSARGDQCVFYVRQEVLLFRLRMKHDAGGEREDNSHI
jgi:hypothetical protein